MRGKGYAVITASDGPEALAKLVTDKSIDVAVVAAGQPAPIITGMKPEAQKLIKFLKFDPNHPASKAALKVYDLSVFSVKMLGRMIVGDLSWKNLSGPITIADYAGQSAKLGWVTWLGFLAEVETVDPVSLGETDRVTRQLLIEEIVEGPASGGEAFARKVVAEKRPRRKLRDDESGFTLIELMVVMAIVALLKGKTA